MQFVCAVCMQAMTHSVANVPSQQAVELLVLGLGFVERCCLRLFFSRPASIKNGVNWGIGFAIGDTDTKNCFLKCLIFQINKENFTFVTFKTDDSIKWSNQCCCLSGTRYVY